MNEVIESPLVSVVIPTYNRAHVVGRAIRSVLNQTFQDLEVIVVDDGSTDDTLETIKRFQDPRLHYLEHREKRGASAARNTGIHIAAGEYIAFLDSDDEWLPEKLDKQVRLLKRSDPAVGAVYTGSCRINEYGVSTTIVLPKDRGTILRKLFAGNTVGATSTVIVRRECIRHVGSFDTAMASCQDWDMWIRLAKYYKFDFVPEALVYMHFDGGGRISNNSRAVEDGVLRIIDKYLIDITSLPRRQRADTLFALGTRLVQGFGVYPSYPRLMRMGRQLYLAAFMTRPTAFHYFMHYCVSFSRRIYRVIAGVKRRVEKYARFTVRASQVP